MIDTTLSTFERDVIDASSDAPVLVSFWSPGCTPCRTLGPMLERLEGDSLGVASASAPILEGTVDPWMPFPLEEL